MARTSVYVKGVLLTQADVAFAVAELSKPDPIACLTVVHSMKAPYSWGVVVTGRVQQAYAATAKFPTTMVYTIVTTDGAAFSYESELSLAVDWVVDFVIGQGVKAS